MLEFAQVHKHKKKLLIVIKLSLGKGKISTNFANVNNNYMKKKSL